MAGEIIYKWANVPAAIFADEALEAKNATIPEPLQWKICNIAMMYGYFSTFALRSHPSLENC